MGYPRVPMASLWPNGGNKANWSNIQAKNIFFFKKILYVIPSALLSFLPYYCHSFRIIVIPSGLLSFLPDYCHSFHVSVIPSELLSFLPNYYNFKYLSSWIAPVPSHTRRARKMATGGGHICEYLLKYVPSYFIYVPVGISNTECINTLWNDSS